MKRFCGFSDSFLIAPVLGGPQAEALAAEACWPLCFCAFTAAHTRGERVLSTCLGHIFVTRESGTIVTFSCGAVHDHSSFPRENTIIVLSVGILTWLRGSEQAVGILGDGNNCFVPLCCHFVEQGGLGSRVRIP